MSMGMGTSWATQDCLNIHQGALKGPIGPPRGPRGWSADGYWNAPTEQHWYLALLVQLSWLLFGAHNDAQGDRPHWGATNYQFVFATARRDPFGRPGCKGNYRCPQDFIQAATNSRTSRRGLSQEIEKGLAKASHCNPGKHSCNPWPVRSFPHRRESSTDLEVFRG